MLTDVPTIGESQLAGDTGLGRCAAWKVFCMEKHFSQRGGEEEEAAC